MASSPCRPCQPRPTQGNDGDRELPHGGPRRPCRALRRLMQADAYAGFGKLYEANRKRGPIVEAACWAHGRRKFFDLARLSKAPIAAEAVKRIDVLFAIEREIDGLAPQQRLRVRQDRSRPLIVELETWLREQRPSSLGTTRRPRRSITASAAGMHSPASLTTGACACRTMRPNASYGPSPWEEEIGPSPAPMGVAGAPQPSTPSSPPPSSTTSIRRLGLPTCWPACRITLPSAITNYCLGTGSLRASLTPLELNQPGLAGSRRRMRRLIIGWC
jgi:transposase IS66 family protein